MAPVLWSSAACPGVAHMTRMMLPPPSQRQTRYVSGTSHGPFGERRPGPQALDKRFPHSCALQVLPVHCCAGVPPTNTTTRDGSHGGGGGGSTPHGVCRRSKCWTRRTGTRCWARPPSSWSACSLRIVVCQRPAPSRFPGPWRGRVPPAAPAIPCTPFAGGVAMMPPPERGPTQGLAGFRLGGGGRWSIEPPRTGGEGWEKGSIDRTIDQLL